MEEKVNKDSLRAAFIAGVSTFVGFLIIFPLILIINGITDFSPVWRNFGDLLGIFVILFGYFLLFGAAVIGLIEAFLLGMITYFVFKFLVPNNATKRQLRAITAIVSVICAIIGVLSFSPADKFIRESNFGKEKIWEIDTSGDKKTDKWVHYDIYERLTEIGYDTNFDGKPDVWEYYKNGKVYKKEIDTNFDGKPDKIENYK